MSKRKQTTGLSSSSRRENVPLNHHVNSIGCMAGILQFVSKYHRPRRFLTFGRKQGKKNEDVPSSPSKAAKPSVRNRASSSSMMRGDKIEEGGGKTRDVRRLSCEVPRSPTLPAEIRRSNSVNSPEKFHSTTPPALVARLMGLEEIPSPESAAEKRRNLLGALEKCDEDLKTIKKIIESLRSLPRPSVANEIDLEDNASRRIVKKCKDRNDKKYAGLRAEVDGRDAGGGEWEALKKLKCFVESNGGQPSPISVLDDFTRPPLNSSCFSKKHITNGRMVQQQKPQPRSKNPREEDMIKACFCHRGRVAATGSFLVKGDAEAAPPVWSSKAMRESVEEVCRDIDWGEKREVGRIGLVLQDYICRDLVEEVVKEIGGGCVSLVLPFEACKRRLSF
ncbi:hypothetical protein U1Q18_014335 [Sarracenia purpurea var. burkii]